MNPLLILGGIGLLSSLFGGGNDSSDVEGGNVSPMDAASLRRMLLGDLTPQGAQLGQLQQSLASSAMNGALGTPGAMPEGLGLEDVATGRLPASMTGQIHQLAFGGMDEGLRRARQQSENYAASRGVPLSSYQFQMQHELEQPLISQAMTTQANLTLQGQQYMSDLRNKELANRLALQQSPALEWLRQQQMLEGTQTSLDMQRFPGGLPEWLYPGAEGSPFGSGTGTAGSTNQTQYYTGRSTRR